MNLRSALRIQRHDIVSLVGAGGKTTTLFQLAHELAATRLHVVTTTTTKIGAPTDEQTPCFIVESDRARMLARVAQALTEHDHVSVASAPYAHNKFVGIAPAWIADLRDLPNVHCVIVEADGARKLPFKAPRADEPVIPPDTTLWIACVGMSALDVRLDEEHVCRADMVSQLSGLPLGARVDAPAIARVLRHPQGGLKFKPQRSRAVALLNQCDDTTRRAAAQQIADSLRRRREFDEVLIGAVAQPDPILERIGRVSAIVMAAGAGTRFGTIKQLAPWGARTMIEHIVALVECSDADEVLVVLGAHADEIQNHLQHIGPRTRIVVNEQWQQGMSTSVRLGLQRSQIQPSAAIFVNVDQPAINPDIINRLIARHRVTGASIVAPRYGNMRGNPVLWDRALFSELHTLMGDAGGREILRQHWREIAWVELESEEELTDTDTPEEYQRLKELLNA